MPIGNVFSKDACPNGDTSPNPYDGRCSPIESSTVVVVVGNPAPSTAVNESSTNPVVTSPIPGRKVRVTKPVRRPVTKPVNPVMIQAVKPAPPARVIVKRKPAATSISKPAVTRRNIPVTTTKTQLVTIATKDTFDVADMLDTLSQYSEIEFDNYDWGQERRLSSAIYTKIDARLENLKTVLELDRPKLQDRLAMLQLEIDRRIARSTTQREARILKYLKTELFILQELYRRVR